MSTTVELRATGQVVYTREVPADEPGALEEFVQDVIAGLVPGEMVHLGSVAVLPTGDGEGDEAD